MEIRNPQSRCIFKNTKMKRTYNLNRNDEGFPPVPFATMAMSTRAAKCVASILATLYFLWFCYISTSVPSFVLSALMTMCAIITMKCGPYLLRLVGLIMFAVAVAIHM
jgi:hypothetical protein